MAPTSSFDHQHLTGDPVQPVARFPVLVLAAAVTLLGGCSAEPAPSAVGPSAGGSSGGSFDLDWDQSLFSPMACPDNQPTATCYGGSATATLPLAGTVTLRRTVIADSARPAGPGCDTADSTGTLTAAQGGTLPIRAAGKLCGLLATYTLTTGAGTGALAGLTIRGAISNNGGAEHWTGAVSRSTP
jgi:hypothetical protein